MEASHTFGAHAGSVRQARRFLRGALEAWSADGYGMVGEQVISELATNAALHAQSEFTVHLLLDDDSLLVEVTDSSRVLPQERHYAVDATTGRGLLLVEALAEEWGVQASPTGKTVWCRLAAGGSVTELVDDSRELAGEGIAGSWSGSAGGGPQGARAVAA